MKLIFSCLVLLIGIGFINVNAQDKTKQAIGKVVLSPCDLDSSCTNDPTYKFFEKEQLRAYCYMPGGGEFLTKLLDTSERKRVYKDVDNDINKRPNSLKYAGKVIDNTTKGILAVAERLPLNSCYEDPGLYYWINELAKLVDRARKQLQYPLLIQPKYGSLPTSEVNAYTYPPDTTAANINKIGSVIGFNRHLFMFAYDMPKVTLPTILVTNDEKSKQVKLDLSREAALNAIESDPNLMVNFNMSILQFIQKVTPSTMPLDRKYDPDLMAFTEAIEYFAVAHEYGHLIKGHQLVGVKQLRLRSENSEDVATVGIRSWPQEIEADEIGLKILFQVLKNQIADEKDKALKESLQMRMMYKLYAPLFFFRCCDIIDKAKYLSEFGIAMPTNTQEEISYFRSIAEGKDDSKMNQTLRSLQLPSHPPGWLRSERAVKIIRAFLQEDIFSLEAKQYAKVGQGLLDNIDLLWGLSVPKFKTVLKAVSNQKIPDKIEYTVSPKYWDITFFENPALQDAVMGLKQNLTVDSVLKLYYKAIQQDWMLFSGIQNRWATGILLRPGSTQKNTAIALLALSGDLQAIDILKKVDTLEISSINKIFLNRCISFLERTGKYTSTEVLLKTPANQFNLRKLLCYPSIDGNLNFDSELKADSVSVEMLSFLRANNPIVQGKSISAMALYMIMSQTKPTVSFSFWADLLLKYGFLDTALQYAKEGVTKGGSNAALENDIGNILSKRGSFEDANQHYAKSIELGRMDGWPELNLARNYSDMGRNEEAEKWFKKAIDHGSSARSQSEYAEYLNEYAWFLIQKHPADTAKRKVALALSIASNKFSNYADPNFLDTLAECLAASGELKLAIQTETEALKLLDENSDVRQKYQLKIAAFKKIEQKSVKK